MLARKKKACPADHTTSYSTDTELWTITLPPELTKNGREHTFPIGAIASTIVFTVMQARQSGILFPARGKASTPFNGWSKSKKALDKLCSIPHWTLHDLRRTFRTNLGRLGVAPHIAERLVNHISARSEMEIVYDQYKYLPEMRQAMETYEDWLRGILGLSTGPSVMPLSFTDKQDGDEVRGVVVTQQDEEGKFKVKIGNFFQDPATKELINGYPKPEGDTEGYSSDDWKYDAKKLGVAVRQVLEGRHVTAKEKLLDLKAKAENIAKFIDGQKIEEWIL